MSTQVQLVETARAMLLPGKGILAMDESHPTCEKRFRAAGIECTAETRRAWRDLLLTTAGLSAHVGAAILFDETIRQQTLRGHPFPEYMAKRGIIPGIKVDKGAKDLPGHPGEKVTEGLDGLRERLAEYVTLGARFTKWRAVITIGPGIPGTACQQANAHALARYAALAQEAGLVPIVEPEVLIDGDHTIERCYAATEAALAATFRHLREQDVLLEGMVLKPSMVLAGKSCPVQATVDQVARETVRCLRRNVPAAVAGVAFLSGGQSNEQATAHLNAMHNLGETLPWPLTFSYARALQQNAMDVWRGREANVPAAQRALLHRARLNGAAALGQYRPEMEQEAA